MSKISLTSDYSELATLFDKISALYSAICKQCDSAGDVICSRKRSFSPKTLAASDHFGLLLTIVTALHAEMAKTKGILINRSIGVVNGALSLMLSCIEQIMECYDEINDVLPSLFTLIYETIVINETKSKSLSQLELTFLLRLLSCISKDSVCHQLSFLRNLCTTIHNSLSTVQRCPTSVSAAPSYFVSGEMVSMEMQISFELSLRKMLLSSLRQPQSTAPRSNSCISWLVNIVHFEPNSINFLSLAEDDEKLFDFLNTSLQLEHSLKSNSSLFTSEIISAISGANSYYFIALLVDVINLDLSTLLDLLCGEETCSLEYLLRFLKSHSLTELELSGTSNNVFNRRVEKGVSDVMRQGVLCLSEETIVTAVESSRDHTLIADVAKGRIRPAIEEWQSKRRHNDDDIMAVADMASIRDLFAELKQQLLRRHTKGHLSFNPAPLLRSIDSFLANT